MRRLAWAFALAAGASVLPGCVIAVGTTTTRSPDERMDQLEKRVTAAEQKLGIPSPEGGR